MFPEATSSPLNRLARVLVVPVLAVVLYGATSSVRGDEESAANPAVFEAEVRGIFQSRCIRCHNSKKSEAGLDLSTPAGILHGSESGRVIRAGSPQDSLLFEKVAAAEMPPDERDRLTADQVASIQKWITSGATFRESVITAPEITQHDIIPLLYLRCAPCHGNRRREAELDVRTKESLLKGGKSGPAVIPGRPEESSILRRIHAGEMPPRRQLVSVSVKPMEADEIQRLARWIELGLPESPREDANAPSPDAQVSDEDRRFWSFQPPQRPAIPTVNTPDRAVNPIDVFVMRKLEEHGLALSPEADRTTLVRRIYIDLVGLPPTPDQITEFVNDPGEQAYERLVDRLLASPRYGERWGRHWLDVAGYADSEGAQNEDRVRPHMYRYRDYVIRSFNADKPYSRFLQEQIAGDELAPYEDVSVVDEGLYDNLVATGFLRTAPDRTFANITNFVPDRLEVIADEMEILGSAVLGLTIKCARCHSHKFDPIPQQDYYRLTAVFKDAYDEHDWLKSQEERTLPQVTTDERRAFERHEQQVEAQLKPLREDVRHQTEAARQKLLEQELASLSADQRKQIASALQIPESDRNAEQKKLVSQHAPSQTLSDDELRKRDADFRRKADTLDKQIKELESQRLAEPRIQALWSRGDPSPTYLLKRGNYLTPGRLVEPGIPTVLAANTSSYAVSPPWENATPTGRRLAFARWLTQREHPLTARVLINRLWQHHFGRGIVGTPGNFGLAGERPTHPELLDWLAVEFVQSNWSIKAMHRLMVTSSTYRQSSRVTEQSLTGDPDGRLLSRMPLRRLEAEVLRDTMLYVAGQLNERPFGPGDPIELRGDGLVTARPSQEGWRRSIYILQRRTQIPTLLDNFDYPQMGPNCIQRNESLVAPQALQLMNDGFVYQLAEQFADRVQKEVGDDREAQIQRIYLRAIGRPPTSDEQAAALDALHQFAARWQSENSGSDQQANHAGQRALVTYCHAVLNLAELLYVD